MAWRARRVIKLVVLAVVAVPIAIGLHRCYVHVRGIEVCLHNVDKQPLRSGKVAVRDRWSARLYDIGDLVPADTACVWVKADDEASVDVTFTTPSGSPVVIPLDGYIEPGNSGHISADVTGEGARSLVVDIHLF